MTNVVIALVLAGLTPIAAYMGRRFYLNRRGKKDAYWRLVGDRLTFPGVILHRIRDGSGGPPLMGRCVITSMEVGRFEVQSLTEGDIPGDACMSWTGKELEGLHPKTLVDPVTLKPVYAPGWRPDPAPDPA